MAWEPAPTPIGCSCCSPVVVVAPYVENADIDAKASSLLMAEAADNEKRRKRGIAERPPSHCVRALKYKRLAPPCMHRFFMTASEKREAAAAATALEVVRARKRMEPAAAAITVLVPTDSAVAAAEATAAVHGSCSYSCCSRCRCG